MKRIFACMTCLLLLFGSTILDSLTFAEETVVTQHVETEPEPTSALAIEQTSELMPELSSESTLKLGPTPILELTPEPIPEPTPELTPEPIPEPSPDLADVLAESQMAALIVTFKDNSQPGITVNSDQNTLTGENPIVFEQTAFEETVYLYGNTGCRWLDSIYLVEDISFLETYEWNLSGIIGSSVSGLQISNSGSQDAGLYYEQINGAGDTTATLTCTAGEYSASIPVTVHVSDAVLPIIVSSSIFTGQVGSTIFIPRPELQVQSTELSPDVFYFDISESDDYQNHVIQTGQSQTGYQVIFDAPGSYSAVLNMKYANICLTHSILVKVVDGNEPTFEITLNPEHMVMQVGDSCVIEALITPPDSCTLVWSTSDAAIASVSKGGIVTAKALGVVTVTATAQDGSGVNGTCEITMVMPPSATLVSRIKIQPDHTELIVGSEHKLTASIQPQNAFVKEVRWSVSDSAIASVDEFGLVTAWASGVVTVTASAMDGSGVQGTCTIRVVQPFPGEMVESISIIPGKVSMHVGKTKQLKATAAPKTALDKTVTWSVSDPAVADVSADGVLTAYAPGQTILTATANDGSGVWASCEVTVFQPGKK